MGSAPGAVACDARALHGSCTPGGYRDGMLMFVYVAVAAPWSTDLAHLEIGFRRRLDTVLEALRSDGYTPVVSCTWRSAALQDVLVQLPSGTQAAGGQSCHNRVDGEGRPAATAADVWDGGLTLGLFLGDPRTMAAQVGFLRALGRHADAAGLRWGGDWHGSPSAWSAHGLGWDPAHVESGRCR